MVLSLTSRKKREWAEDANTAAILALASEIPAEPKQHQASPVIFDDSSPRLFARSTFTVRHRNGKASVKLHGDTSGAFHPSRPSAVGGESGRLEYRGRVEIV